MPLPFSFSTQRQGSEVERPPEPVAIVVSEKVMNHAPGHVSTEPLLGGTFLPSALETASRAALNYLGLAAGHLTPERSPQQPFAVPLPDDLTLQSLPSATEPQLLVAQDWAAQIEQLRNDIFGIAMNVSAMNDRLDRMEQRLLPAGQSLQAGISTLRGEIETWLESHLNVAVEHCMHRVINHTNSSVSTTVN